MWNLLFGRWQDPLIAVLSLPCRALSWLTGRTTPNIAADVIWLHPIGMLAVDVYGGADPVAYIVDLLWFHWTRRDYVPMYRAMDREYHGVKPKEESTLRIALLLGLIVSSIATAKLPNGPGELVWWHWTACHAAALYNGRGGKSVLDRVRDRVPASGRLSYG